MYYILQKEWLLFFLFFLQKEHYTAKTNFIKFIFASN